MKKQAIEQLGSVIRENTESRTLEELAAAGKSQFRVVTGEKILQLIEAIVDDVIERETLEKAQEDRDRLVEETRQEFARVMKLQNEQEAAVQEHREQRLQAEVRLRAFEEQIEAERERLAAKEERLESAVRALEEEIVSLKAKTASNGLSEIKTELAEMHQVVQKVAERPTGPDAATLELLLSHLDEKERSRASELEDRIHASLERTVDDMARRLRMASSGTVDVPVEATAVLVERVFDQEQEMKTNLDVLAIEELNTSRDVSDSLARLRRARRDAREKN